jgi:hypothetical protein
MRDFNLELLACVDIDRALEYIGKCTHHKNIYQNAKSPSFSHKHNPKNPKIRTLNHGSQS